MNGLFIPNEIEKLTTLNWTEKALLAKYWYFSDKKLKCCKKTNDDLCKELMVSEKTFKRMKKHLKELGYIRTDGGIRVYYLGVKPKTAVEETVEEPQIIKKETVKKVENKPIVEETVIKNTDMGNTNFERIYEQLPNEYKNEDIKNYVVSAKKDWVNTINTCSPGALNVDLLITQLKKFITNKFHIYEETKKEEPMSKLQQEFLGVLQNKESTEEYTEEDNELYSWLNNITVEPKVEYGAMN